jgi:hypothetical protein
MPYKYYSIKTSGSPTHTLVTDFQALLNAEFETASDIFDITEEATLGSGTFSTVRVRITGAVSSVTGKLLSDDFKQLLFKDINHTASLGKKYIFSDNTWLCTYSEVRNTLGANCMVRRANNQLRWVDSAGVVYTEPVVLEYEISRPRDLVGTENLVLPQGYVTAYAQLNSKTRKIKGNQRFLFGPLENRICLKVFGDGVRNYLNEKTTDDTSSTLLQLSLGGNFVNADTDDLVNGIADRYLNYDLITSASTVGALSIVSVPNTNYVIESGSQVYDVRYYSGSTALSGSFVFGLANANVPVDHYLLTTMSANSFAVNNLEKYLDSTLDITCSGSSGSRVLNLELRGRW